MTDPTDALARIDATIEAWELWPDAARWTPDAPEPQFTGILAALDGVYTRLAPCPPRCRCSTMPADYVAPWSPE